MSDCIFCAIVQRQAEASYVFEDDMVVAFMTLEPVSVGHVLVIPRAHLPYLADVPRDIAAHMFTVGQELAAALRRSSIPCEGVNLFYADGRAAFQEVFHAHLHVFPRTTGDGFGLVADWRVRARPELDAAAAELRAALS
jgi:histidine triad (HIT) family protein